MGLISSLRFAAQVAGGHWSTPNHLDLASPWAPQSTLVQAAYTDIFGGKYRGASRADAMRVPAIAKGRALICGTLSRQPLAQYADAERVDAAPFLYRSAYQSPATRMLWTLDDIIFGGASVWQVERDTAGTILDAARVRPDEWDLDDDLRILVQGQPMSPEEVLFIEGPQEGLCTIAGEDIAASISMSRAWANRVDAPVPLVALAAESAATFNLTEDETQEVVDAWEDARRRGGTAFLPAGLRLDVHGDTPTDLFVEGRNAARLDFANYLNLPGALLDGSTATASLTYSTKESARNELVDLSLLYWANPIEARLSQDDVVPTGQRVEFDVSYLATPTQPAAGPAKED